MDRIPIGRPVVTNHALITICGRDSRGQYTTVWMTSYEPVDLMCELQKYKTAFPDLSRIEVTFELHDQERNKPISFL